MVQLFANFGALIRMLIGLGFAAMWGFMSWYWYGMGEDGPGMPTVVGVGFLAALAGLGAFFNLMKLLSGTKKAVVSERSTLAAELDAPSDFDADAVMARYLAQRGAAGEAAPRSADPAASTAPSLPPRPQFGRKAV